MKNSIFLDFFHANTFFNSFLVQIRLERPFFAPWWILSLRLSNICDDTDDALFDSTNKMIAILRATVSFIDVYFFWRESIRQPPKCEKSHKNFENRSTGADFMRNYITRYKKCSKWWKSKHWIRNIFHYISRTTKATEPYFSSFL